MGRKALELQMQETDRRRRRLWRVVWILGGVILIAGLLFAARFVRPQTPVNVLFITVDTTRADHLSCYGYTKIKTPALDALAKSGVRFDRAFSPVPLTLPSHATMLTGLYPSEHGCRLNGKRRLADGVTSMTEVFKKKGYRTAAFIAAFVMVEKFGLDKGFDVYDDADMLTVDQIYDDKQTYRYRRGNVMTDTALKWFKENETSEKPFFCWVHYYDPHRPYHTTENGYDNEIVFMDREIGRLLKYLEASGKWKNTLVVVVGDHGEGLGDHGEDEHGLLLINSLLRVPLIFSLPGRIEPRQVVREAVCLTDIFPTMMDFLGWKMPVKVTGRSVADALRGKPIETRPIYAETLFPLAKFNWQPTFAVISNDWKLIRATRSELFNIGADFEENHNAIKEHPDMAATLEELLDKMIERMKVRDGAMVRLDAADEAALRSLGYAGGSEVPQKKVVLPDPRDMVDIATRYVDVLGMRDRKQHAEAEKTLREMIRRTPDSYPMYEELLEVLFDQEKYEEGARQCEESLKKWPEEPRIHYQYGTSLIKLEKYEKAVEALQTSVRLDPSRARAYNNLGIALLKSGKKEDALKNLKKAVELRPDQPDAYNNIGVILLETERPGEAEKAFRDAILHQQKYPDAYYNLGLSLLAQRRPAEAEKAFRVALDQEPGHVNARNRLERLLQSKRPPPLPVGVP